MTAIWFPSGDPSLFQTQFVDFGGIIKLSPWKVVCPTPDQSVPRVSPGHGNWLRNCPGIQASPARYNLRFWWNYCERDILFPLKLLVVKMLWGLSATWPWSAWDSSTESLPWWETPHPPHSLRLGLLVTLAERHQVLMETFNLLDQPMSDAWLHIDFSVIQSDVNQKEKHQYSILTHIYGVQKDGNDNPGWLF